MTAMVGGLLGLGIGAGLLLIILGSIRRPVRQRADHDPWRVRWARATRRPEGKAGRRRDLQLAATLVVSLAVVVATQWLAALVIIPSLTLVLPWLLADTNKDMIARNSALADWTRNLRGLMVGGSAATLEGALIGSLSGAPPAIRPQVSALIARLSARTPTDQALEEFANDLDSEQGDLVVTALMSASRQRGSGIAQVLGRLADAVSAEVEAYRQIEALKAAPRNAARTLTAILFGVAVIWPLFSPPHQAFYSSGIGQLVLVVLAVFALLSLWVLRRMATVVPKPRIFPAAAGAPQRVAA